jgi:hypothetical protein
VLVLAGNAPAPTPAIPGVAQQTAAAVQLPSPPESGDTGVFKAAAKNFAGEFGKGIAQALMGQQQG